MRVSLRGVQLSPETGMASTQTTGCAALELSEAHAREPPHPPRVAITMPPCPTFRLSRARATLDADTRVNPSTRPTRPSTGPSCPARPALSRGAGHRSSSSASSSSVLLPRFARRPASKLSPHIDKLSHSQQDNEDAFCKALEQDLGRSAFETTAAELIPIKAEINDVCDHFEKWAKPQKAKTSLTWVAAKPVVYSEPKGEHLRLLGCRRLCRS